MIEDFIKEHKETMIKKLQELIQIPSVYSESKNPLMPFGENANKALEYMLNLGKSLGFKTKNIDGYCGYIEFGEGEEMLGIIGHLDVVPSGEQLYLIIKFMVEVQLMIKDLLLLLFMQ